jgi:hypothetical protein
MKLFSKLSPEREPFLNRAREAARLTIPLVIRPDKGDDSNTDYETPYQSIGARGVTNLSSNLLLSLFPSNVPFFRLLVSDADFESFGDKAEQIKEEVEDSLRGIEKTVLEEIENKNLRPSIFDALKNLLISGNALVYVQPDGNLRVYSLEDYVVHRDIEGNLTTIGIKEIISKKVVDSMGITLPSDMSLESDELGMDKVVRLCTYVELQDDGTYKVYQTVGEELLPDTEQVYEKEDLPFLALRLSKVTGESYGRGYVESVVGDLNSLEALQKALVESAAISAKTLFLLDPAAITRARVMAKAKNGDIITGRAGDVSILRTDKGADLGSAFQASQTIEKRLSYAFNLLEASMPTSPAVTATEINSIINALEKVMAGVYAMLASEFMQPLVRIIISRLSEEGVVPQLPDKVKLIISTGLTALGRNSDLERIAQFAQLASQLAPEAFGMVVDQEKMLRQIENAVGVDLLKSREQLALEKQQAAEAQQAMMSQQRQMEDEAQVRSSMWKIAEQVVPEELRDQRQ